MTKDQAKTHIEKLVNRFTEQQKSYHAADYNETKTRRDFIDPFFKALGWDMDNEQDVAEPYREVIHEDKIKIHGKTKSPDYGFRLQGAKQQLFFVEAKKPAVDLKVGKEAKDAAFQIRRYGWNSKVSVSILTNFEVFIVYDCTKKPNVNDSASLGRLKTIHFHQYLEEFDFIYDTFSREAIVKGRFDTYIKSDTAKKGTQTLDKAFVTSLDSWRQDLAINIADKNRKLNEDEINSAVQLIIDRLIFLRFCEDRSIEIFGNLKIAVSKGNLYENLLSVFKLADDKYNSGLFDFKKDNITRDLIITNKVIKQIVLDLYPPNSEYDFKAMPVEVLGNAYEQFLGKVIRITKSGYAVIEEKPEVRHAGGVYYTPQYIVDYIVENTVGKLIANKTPKEIESIKIVDPACGSGSFLLGAFQYLLNYHIHYYHTNSSSKENKAKLTPSGTLSTAEKKKILINNIYGVDIDDNAVEVSKLSLLLKCMEGETDASIKQQFDMLHERVLPDLDNNIKGGNSLIDTDIYDTEFDLGFERKIKPFSWEKQFSQVFKNGGFDAVIGNPPYVRIHELDLTSKEYYSKNFKSAQGQFDLYQLFYEKSINLIKDKSLIGFITSNKFCATNYGKNLRVLLFENNRIEKIVDCSNTRVFGDASTYPYIFIFGAKNNSKNKSQLFIDENKIIKFYKEVNQKELLKGEEKIFSFSNTEPSFKIIEKLDLRISDNTHFVYRGRGTSKDISEKSIGIKVLTNREIERYSLKKSNYFRTKTLYENDFQPKILMKKICFNLECAYDSEGSINPINTVYVVKPNTIFFNYEYLLGVLNSKLLSFYARKKYASTGMRGGYIELRVFEIIKLPIIIPLNNKEELKFEIVKHVDLLLKLNEEIKDIKLQTKIDQVEQRIAHSEDRINQLVYALYELTEDEIKIVEEASSK
jgi:type I restriction-modification system DNA methylase subunit